MGVGLAPEFGVGECVARPVAVAPAEELLLPLAVPFEAVLLEPAPLAVPFVAAPLAVPFVAAALEVPV